MAKKAKATARAITQKQANDLLSACLPDAIAFLLATINDDACSVKERLTAAKLVVDRCVPAASTYADESITPQSSEEEDDGIAALMKAMSSFSDATRKKAK